MATLEPAAVRFVPLGGLGEIGMNCLALEQGDDLMVIDCGTSFPSEDVGVDVVIPDFSYLLERKALLRGVFLTHGHDDHIGALPFLLRQMRVPVWGPPHALALVKRRMEDHGMKPNGFDLRPTTPRSSYVVGSFVVEPVRVSHSIIEATALKVETAAGTVVHSGDFKFDAEPPDGEPTDEARLDEIGRAGVGLLLSDSTNVDSAEPTSSEQVVGVSLERLIQNASGRVFVVLFASNVQRLILIGAIARATRRKVCLLGRSLVNHVEVALEIGRLDWPSDLRVSPEEARTMRPGEVLVLAGGSQGERQSAMARLAAGMHQELSLEPGDTVIFSSRVIPGNDRAVLRVMNDVIRRGAQLHTYRTDPRCAHEWAREPARAGSNARAARTALFRTDSRDLAAHDAPRWSCSRARHRPDARRRERNFVRVRRRARAERPRRARGRGVDRLRRGGD